LDVRTLGKAINELLRAKVKKKSNYFNVVQN
jgi:hypothetical protein